MSKLSLNDLWKRYLDAAVGTAQGGDGTGVTVSSPQQANKWASKVAGVNNSAAAPVQFTVLSNLTVTDGTGLYLVKVTYGYGPTSEATTPDNFQLLVNVSTTIVSSLPAPVAAANTLFPRQDFYVSLAQGDIVKLITNSNGSAGSIYKTMIVLERVS
jgi:hypothetical protein